MAAERVVCVDVGSTFTKAALVELDSGRLLGTASHRTTVDTDVMDGVDACRAALAAEGAEVVACSSAGGGLRLAVVGYEREVTAEAGHRVGLSAGARVVHVASGPMATADVRDLAGARPDVVLLVGGTDGGNSEVLLHNADRLARSRLRVPVVAAGNADSREEVVALLDGGARTVIGAPNVLPEIGRLAPGPARAAIREVFIRHVIGGKRLSRRADFPAMVRAATPDAVLSGVELLADGHEDVPGAGDVLVVDVGGATTDVYSVVTPQGEDAVLRKEVVEVMWRSRTVEGDLGMRWGAVGVVDAAVGERLLGAGEEAALRAAAEVRVADPSYLPSSGDERAVDARLAELAARWRCAGTAAAARTCATCGWWSARAGCCATARRSCAPRCWGRRPRTSRVGGRCPSAPGLVVDDAYVLAAAGLLSADDPGTAARLLAGHL